MTILRLYRAENKPESLHNSIRLFATTLSTEESLRSDVPLDDEVRERVIFLGGIVAGVDCPECSFRSRDIELDVHSLTSIDCPECSTTILTEEQRAQLRKAGKL